jgi:hypothetical protein
MVFSATFNNISVISWGETKNHLLHILAVNDYLVLQYTIKIYIRTIKLKSKIFVIIQSEEYWIQSSDWSLSNGSIKLMLESFFVVSISIFKPFFLSTSKYNYFLNQIIFTTDNLKTWLSQNKIIGHCLKVSC